jgi:hypothetical protein
LWPLAFSNMGASVPSTSGIGPAVLTNVISAAFAALPAISTLTHSAAADATIFDVAVMASSLCLI